MSTERCLDICGRGGRRVADASHRRPTRRIRRTCPGSDDVPDLTAAVGTVGLDEFGEEGLRRNLEDLDWLAATARAHDAVISAIARFGAGRAHAHGDGLPRRRAGESVTQDPA